MSETLSGAMRHLGAAATAASHAMTRFYWGWSHAYLAPTPSDIRRLERDYARAARRPALIHKGGKP